MRHYCFAFLLFFFSGFVFAAQNTQDFYAASVAVPDRSVVNMQQGLREILLKVLSKVSGQDAQAIRQKPSLAQDLALGDQYASQFVYYYRSHINGQGIEEKQLRIKASFPEKQIMNLLQKGHLVFWAPGRPALKTWLLWQNAGSVSWLDNNANYKKQVQQELSDAMLQWGFEVDTGHSSALSAYRLWQGDESYRQALQAKYDEPILIGRIDQVQGTVSGTVSLLGLGQNTSQLVQADDVAQWTQKSIDWAAKKLANYYAVALRASDSEVVLLVDNISSYADYDALLSYVKAIDFVSNVYVLGASYGQLKLAVQIQTDNEQLKKRLLRDNRLIATEDDASFYQLYLRWNP